MARDGSSPGALTEGPFSDLEDPASSDHPRIPASAQHLALRGGVRPGHDPRSSLYDTDAQIFSDAGVPVVLFMENYDIDRSG